ncbi:MAG: DedA family protein [Thermodesulfobacteriota bacterium]|nr:DedA family protein [Thermodesulfobacteriota bacterium]
MNIAYSGIALALIGRGVGVPIPEDIPLLTAGFLCAHQVCQLKWMLPVAWFSVITADSLSFLGGRFFRGQLPRLPIIRIVFSPARMRKAERFYQRHGLKGLLAARFMPGLRTPLFFTAGTARIPFFKFFITDMMTAVISVAVLVGLGWYFPTRLNRLQNIASWYKWGSLLLAALVMVVIMVWKFFKARR